MDVEEMSLSAVGSRLWRALRAVISAVSDALPPYHWVEGRLVAKEVNGHGTHCILVEEEIVQVDWLTYETLMLGEALRIRCTRDNKAINIDRLMP